MSRQGLHRIPAAADRLRLGSGTNGGTATLKATGQTLVGDVTADVISSVTIVLAGSSGWSGALDAKDTAKAASVTLDSSSTWTMTADSHVTALTGAVVSNGTITNMVGHGNTVTYDSGSSPELAGKRTGSPVAALSSRREDRVPTGTADERGWRDDPEPDPCPRCPWMTLH